MPRGFSQRAELAPRARELRAQGWKLREIGEELGVKRTTVGEWCADPDRAKHRARRMKYAGKCLDCGDPTDGSYGPGRASVRCRPCAHAWGTKASREWIIDSIVRWADEHGGIPPSATDWNPSQARGLGHVARAEEYERGDWPAASGVLARFGSWNDGIRAAGFEPNDAGRYGRPGEDPELCAEIRARYEAGESGMRLAWEYGCSPETIYYRVRKAGGTIRSREEATELRKSAA